MFVFVFQGRIKGKGITGGDDAKIDDEIHKFKQERNAVADEEFEKEMAEVIEKAREKTGNTPE